MTEHTPDDEPRPTISWGAEPPEIVETDVGPMYVDAAGRTRSAACAWPVGGSQVDPLVAIDALRDRLNQLQTFLMAGREFGLKAVDHPAAREAAAADRRGMDILMEAFLVHVDRISFECGLIFGERSRLRAWDGVHDLHKNRAPWNAMPKKARPAFGPDPEMPGSIRDFGR